MAGIDKRKAVQAALNYTHQRRFDKAIAEYKNALSADPQDLNVHMKLGDLYAQTGAIQEAIATYMKLGDLYRADGLAVKAIAIYKKVLTLDPKNMQIYLACADLYAEQGLVGEAKIQYMTVAEHYTKAGNTPKALEIFQKIAALDPTNFAVAAKVGEMFERERLPDQAASHYAAAAEAAGRMGRPKEAVDLYGRALKLKPTAFAAHYGLGRIHFDAGALAEASAALERAAAAAPDNAAPLLLLGECYRRLAVPDKAEGALRRAVAADPTAAEAHLALARLLGTSGRGDEAQEAFTKVADQLLEQGRGEEALILFREVCGEQPQGTVVLAKLAELCQQLGREEEAREVERRLALIWEETGRPGEAAAIYRRHLEGNPDDLLAQERLQALDRADRDGQMRPVPLEEPPPEEEATPRVIPITSFPGEASAEGVPVSPEGQVDLASFLDVVSEGVPEAPPEDDASEVAEQLAEADVYLKYGLVEKAVERLRETVSEAPGNIAARQRLRQIFLDEGRTPEATAEGLALVDALVAGGQAARAAQELEVLRLADPNHPEVQARLQGLRVGTGPPAPVPAVEEAPASAPAPGAPVGLSPVSLPGAPPAPGVLEVLALGEPAEPEEAPTSPPGAIAALAAFPVEEATGLEDPLAISDLLQIGGPGGGPPTTTEAAEEPLSFDLPHPAAGAEEPFRLDLPPMDEAAEAVLAFAPETPGRNLVPELPVSLGGVEEELEEAEFFRSQGMTAEAAAVYRRILSSDPGNAQAQTWLAALTAAPVTGEAAESSPPSPARLPEPVAPLPALTDDTWIPGPDPFALQMAQAPQADVEAAPPHPADAGSGVELVDLEGGAPDEALLGMGEILESEPPAPPPVEAPGGPAPPLTAPAQAAEAGPLELAPHAVSAPPSAAPPPVPSRRGIGPAEDVPVFRVARPVEDAGPGGFVNLGDELKQELQEPPRLPVSAEGEALLNALLEEFQRGVRENLDTRDYETHYNLGIAYKEMDLFDEAIEAFRLAAQDPSRRLTCADLIGLCYLGKGQAQQAAEMFAGALVLPGYPPEEYYGLRYNLGTAYEAAGQEAKALGVLEELLGQAPTFREVKARVEGLRQRLGGEADRPAPPLAAARATPTDGGTEPPTPKPGRPRRDKVSFV